MLLDPPWVPCSVSYHAWIPVRPVLYGSLVAPERYCVLKQRLLYARRPILRCTAPSSAQFATLSGIFSAAGVVRGPPASFILYFKLHLASSEAISIIQI
jgi:hypothetical protein